MSREDAYFEALRVRDHRFDGKFFVGVKTTGIYCRPICPAKPKRENVEFFPNRLAAERAGYRPCLRCRPESAPMSPAWIGKSAVVRRAIKIMHDQEVLHFNEDQFAARFGVSARHLRRLFIEEVGKTPKQLAFEIRLNLARQLLTETTLPVTDVAYASGFRSLRRFNDAFKERFKRSPSQIRRGPVRLIRALTLTLAYRPPYDFEELLRIYRSHQVGRLEKVDDHSYQRVICWQDQIGEVTVSNDPDQSALVVKIDHPKPTAIHAVLPRVRAMFDLDSDPVVIANALEVDPHTKKMLRRRPGLRLASGWDPFEVAVGAILGQLVSVDFARTLLHDLIEMLGEPVAEGVKLFPTPKQIASSQLKGLRTTGRRKQSLITFARMIHDGDLSLEQTQDVSEFTEKFLTIPGIGPWTAAYVALRALRHTDAFPATDLILKRALELHPGLLDRVSPWGGYLAALFWREYSQTLKRRKLNDLENAIAHRAVISDR